TDSSSAQRAPSNKVAVHSGVRKVDVSRSPFRTRIGYVTVGPPLPVADFTGTPTSGPAPLTVQFTDASIGSPSSWEWDFENDGTVDSTAESPEFTYTAPGTYSVSLRVTNASGTNMRLRTDYVAVGPPLPLADFTRTPTSGPSPLIVQ